MSVYVDAELLNVLEPEEDRTLSASAAAGAGSYNKQGLTLLSRRNKMQSRSKNSKISFST